MGGNAEAREAILMEPGANKTDEEEEEEEEGEDREEA